MAKKNAALSALEAGFREEEPAPAPVMQAVEPVSQNTPAPQAPVRAKPRKKGGGQVLGTVYLPRAIHQQLRQLAFDENISHNTLYLRGLDLLFQKLGNRSVKELTGQDVWHAK